MTIAEFKSEMNDGGYLARYWSETGRGAIAADVAVQVSCPDKGAHAHGDKNKSARYYPGPGAHVHCHACGGNWDIFGLVQFDEHCDFMGAVKSLARRYGFDLATGVGRADPPSANVRIPLDGDLRKCAEYVRACAGHVGETDYLAKRGISVETCQRFGVGFDPVEKRVVLPHGDGFAARAIEESDALRYKFPKGVKVSPFNSSALWKSGGRTVFIVEGAIDALSIIEAGGVAVGLGGITNGKGLIETIKANGPVPVPVVVCFDNDAATNKTVANGQAKLRADLRALGVFVFDGTPVAPRYKDANEQLVADRAGLVSSVEALSAAALSAFALKDEAPKIRTFADFADPVPEEVNPRALFANGWLRKGGGAIVVSTAGAGKSVFSLQCALHWAAGRECLGIRPVRRLKVAVIQSEDDEDEMRYFKVSMYRGMRGDGWTEADINAAATSVYFPADCFGCAGENFINALRAMQMRDHYDLVIVNPLFAYFGDDLSDNRADVHFFREMLDPLLKDEKNGFGIMFIHHANKPPRGKDSAGWGTDEFAQYIGAGGTDLAGWARAQLVFLPVPGKMGYFKLLGAKRADALGWRNDKGERVREKYIAHSDGFAYWRVPSSEEAAGLVPSSGGVVSMDYLQRIKRLSDLLRDTPLPGTQARALARKEFGRAFGDEAYEAIVKAPRAYGVEYRKEGRLELYGGRADKSGEKKTDGETVNLPGLGVVSDDPPASMIPDPGPTPEYLSERGDALPRASVEAADFVPQEDEAIGEDGDPWDGLEF